MFLCCFSGLCALLGHKKSHCIFLVLCTRYCDSVVGFRIGDWLHFIDAMSAAHVLWMWNDCAV